ncbi:GTPase ObgE, partial [Burkholderiales bacterium]|nr:GTPase ObgE [Burkholderiales bacterium]
GAGLGHQFLKHLQRTKLLVHVIDIGTDYPDVEELARNANDICHELQKYDVALFNKPRWVALNKMDLIPEEDRDAFVTEVTTALSNGLASTDKIFPISSVSGLGTKSLIDSAMEYMSRIKQEDKTTNTNSLNKV